jgi:hypothetical protein
MFKDRDTTMHKCSELPWEAPGCFRHDCEPHRGQFLRLLGTVSAMCGLASLCLVLPGLVGLPAGIIVGIVARKDLAMMNAGLMDPRGKELCEIARIRAGIGTVSSSLALLFVGSLWLIIQICVLVDYLHGLR